MLAPGSDGPQFRDATTEHFIPLPNENRSLNNYLTLPIIMYEKQHKVTV